MTMPGASDTALIESYLQHLQTQRKLSGHTLENYQRDLVQLGEFAREYKHPSLASLSTFDLFYCAQAICLARLFWLDGDSSWTNGQPNGRRQAPETSESAAQGAGRG
jgi:hypothetical protein